MPIISLSWLSLPLFCVDRVQVVTKVDTGPNAGYYFEGVGCATTDDDLYATVLLHLSFEHFNIRIRDIQERVWWPCVWI